MSNDEARLSARRLVTRLRSGTQISDLEFDRFLPKALRAVSAEYWTTLGAAKRAAEWFSAHGVGSVVDIGSGVGKFCVATAIFAERLRFTGVEQRPRFVQAARTLAHCFEVETRVAFVEGGIAEAGALPADAYYLYNPFAENLVAADDALDAETELTAARYARDIAAVEALFSRAPAGTHVLTYNGFGGRFPPGYAQVRIDQSLPYELALWHKTGALPIAREC
jgi:SAM-dependent methyltransferase